MEDSKLLTEEQRQEKIRNKCFHVKFGTGKLSINLNPVVSIVAAALIWIFVIICLIKTDLIAREMSEWMKWVTKVWTWMYIGTQDVWAVFIIYLYFSKYSSIKLGKDDDEPEFSDITYFTMLFASGVGTGLFFYGVAEPIYHYQPSHDNPFGNRYQGRYSDNQKAQDALNLTIFHWGIHGWIVYDMIALILAFLCFRKDVPMTMRSCFEPLIGEKVYGIFGDIVDILTIMCTMFGVCTSLGIGSKVISGGIERLGIGFEANKTNQIYVIWGITIVATLSVVSGVKLGIRRLSEIAFSLGMFLWFYVLFSDDTWYLFNVFVQSAGYYMQWVVQLGFHTGAFEQMGDAPDGKEAPAWMGAWTVFYWGWWIAWAPLIGIFIAKISRGRTIRGFLTFTLTIPIVFCLMWFCVFGGAGLRMERAAARANITCSSSIGGSSINATSHPGTYEGGIYRLSCRRETDMFFDVLNQYSNVLPGFLTGISIVTMVLYFVTSSDSGSLVIDSISANGHPDPPIIQRIFWALTEGATASALVAAGSDKALTALQSVSICSGLIYTVILNFICIALWRLLRIEAGDLDPNGPKFSVSLIDIVYHPSLKRLFELIIAIFAPWWPIGNAAGKAYGSNRYAAMVMMAIPFYGWIILQILQVWHHAMAMVGWAVLFGFLAYATGVRSHIREKYEIEGNLAEDMFAVMLVYPLAAVQMNEHMHAMELMKKDDRGESNDTAISLEYIKDNKNTVNPNAVYYQQNGKSKDHMITSNL